MRLETIKSPGIAHTSYYLSDSGEAAVVDPRRDIEAYDKLSAEDCSQIKYILETHKNEDYVGGSVELKEASGAEICHSKELPPSYVDHNLEDGEIIGVGSLRVKAVTTPGHTLDSICYTVTDTRIGPDPFMVFTGDTLFVGDVGRTDLSGSENWERLSGLLFDSIHGKLIPLGDHVLIYPAHTSGSICGNRIGDREVSTIGLERRTNPMLRLDRNGFVGNQLKNRMLRPPYFSRMESLNLNGPPLIKYTPRPKHLPIHDFESIWKQPDTIVVDTRNPEAFASSHIPGSLSIWLEGISHYAGWAVTYDKRIILVLERGEDAEKATTYLKRLGYDEIVGYLCSGIAGWRNRGKTTESFGAFTAPDLKDAIRGGDITLLDVREEDEYASGHIPGAVNIYVGHVAGEASKIEENKPVVVTCGWGGRGSLAASILRRHGVKNVSNLLGGMNAWSALEYPIEKA